MYKRDAVYQTKNMSSGTNHCKYIILHHTGVIGKWNLPILLGQRKTTTPVSAHVLIDRTGKAFKLADPSDITRHAWVSSRGYTKNMNDWAIGIEIEGTNLSGFTNQQYAKVVDLVKYLMATFHIPKENVLRHADITRFWSQDMKLRDGVSTTRKTDVDRRLRSERGFANFKERREKTFTA